MKTYRIEALDTLRGVACLFVFFSHVVGTNETYGMYLNGCGKIGVWYFMLVSGFLSFLPYANGYHRAEEFRIADAGNYWIKKIKKIIPPYYLCLIIAYLMGYIPSGRSMIGHMLFLEGTIHFWYMPVIMKFYLLFPLIIWMYGKMKPQYFTVILLLVGTVLALIFPFTTYEENSIRVYWYLPVFLMGILLSILYTHIQDNTITGAWWDVVGVIAFVAILMLTPVAKKVFWGIEPSRWLQNKYILITVLWIGIVLAVLWGGHTKELLAKCRFLRVIGTYSFEIYLIHYVILMKLKDFIGNTIYLGIVVCVISLLSGWCIHEVCKRVLGK